VSTHEWQAEASTGSQSSLSQGTLEDGTPALLWHLRVASDSSSSPYAAIRFPTTPQLASHRGIQLRARSDRPMRISAQLRASSEGGRRWTHSLYVDQRPRLVELRFEHFKPVTETVGPAAPALKDVDSLLLVADTVHAAPGTAATVAISELWLVKR
jgi:hypothetical protein